MKPYGYFYLTSSQGGRVHVADCSKLPSCRGLHQHEIHTEFSGTYIVVVYNKNSDFAIERRLLKWVLKK
jgi:hypothetical protein